MLFKVDTLCEEMFWKKPDEFLRTEDIHPQFFIFSVGISETLDKQPLFSYNSKAIGVWRSLVSRLVRVQEASGSNPDTPTKKDKVAFATLSFFI